MFHGTKYQEGITFVDGAIFNSITPAYKNYLFTRKVIKAKISNVSRKISKLYYKKHLAKFDFFATISFK